MSFNMPSTPISMTLAMISNALSGFGLYVLSARFAPMIGASPIEASVLLLDGFFIGIVGSRFLIGSIVKRTRISKKKATRVFFGSLEMILLCGPVLTGSLLLAYHAETNAPWEVRLAPIGLAAYMSYSCYQEMLSTLSTLYPASNQVSQHGASSSPSSGEEKGKHDFL